MIQVTGRFIRQQCSGAQNGSPCDGDALALPAGQFSRTMMCAITQIECLQGSMIRILRSAGGIPVSIRGSSMFSAAVSRGIR